ncbi:MAG: serine/threonine-protein phosphatase [Actinobacteria bacterium]|nr:serine/threonine-protein phosphatase [Actinomycetota bacterium]
MKTDQRALSALLRAADSGSVDSLALVLREVLAGSGATDAILYLSDYNEELLRPAPGYSASEGAPDTIDIEGTLPGRAYGARELVEDESPECIRVWVPVVERSEPFGVLELHFDAMDDDKRRMALDAGLMVGHLLMSARSYTDVYELLRRRRDMNLAAEMHWDILPARHYTGPSLSICGDIEPAYEVGGDAFDYSVNNGVLDITIMDAMGHGLEAALLSSQSIGAYRYARRRNLPLEDVVATIDDALVRQFGGEKFVTGFFGRLEIDSGGFSWVNAGHVAPLLLRDGRLESPLGSAPSCPMGLELIDASVTQETTLEANDCLFFYSDGVIEAKTPAGELFTLERLARLVEEHEVEEGESGHLVRKVIDEVVRHAEGPLKDDATCLLLQYLGSP